MTPCRGLPLPPELAALRDLALDLRWTWSHRADALWAQIDPALWERTHNPWALLEDVPGTRLAELAADRGFVTHLDELAAERRTYLQATGWFAETYDTKALGGVAFFCMEFGLGEALPLYAGGLGVLAGDFMKTASDLGIPAIGIGLLYQEGYFRQMIDAAGWQQDAYPYNEPAMMPVEPVLDDTGARRHVTVALPGRTLRLRVWRAGVGRTVLYLLDSNDPLNSPVDRGITSKLYGGGTELRMLQEIVLGIGGWRLVEAIHPEIEICHLNEGHAAFAVLERARSLSERTGISFDDALWATRAGNIFTTHTPVAAGFDRFPISISGQYRHAVMGPQADAIGLTALALTGGTVAEPFNMAFLALRGAYASFAVSALHGAVSRDIFQRLFPRWPRHEVPVGHVTNGVHMPTWDSRAADAIFTQAGGKERWRQMAEPLQAAIATVGDDVLWEMRAKGRLQLVEAVRRRLGKQLGVRGYGPAVASRAESVLDPNLLTLGFARRFTAYKRPNLLLRDRARLERLLNDPQRPVQLVVAGKAHPADVQGKQMIQEWVAFTEHPSLWHRVVFLEDYDIALAQEMVQGVDVWINTPRRPWEACGTSGMKVLVNGGLNLSELDGWWAEAFDPELGWAIGTTTQPDERTQDDVDAAELYARLEQQVLPAFYDRDAAGIPRAWLTRVRQSMARLSPQFSATRMLRDYLDQAYLPAAAAVRRRLADGAAVAKALRQWERRLHHGWKSLHIGRSDATAEEDGWSFCVPVYLGEVDAADIRVELYADAGPDTPPQAIPLDRGGPVAGAVNGYTYTGRVATARPRTDFTVRILPYHPEARVPVELPLIRWQE
ncbi:MAG: alpha-glucan family phosphorylase [Rhodospirillales bacterium]|jgi:starch phosphorylase|nr:alpha-glucan family phosphorylase [Rhodospirillales bacterium]